jgi:hypothetical protein
MALFVFMKVLVLLSKTLLILRGVTCASGVDLGGVGALTYH